MRIPFLLLFLPQHNELYNWNRTCNGLYPLFIYFFKFKKKRRKKKKKKRNENTLYK